MVDRGATKSVRSGGMTATVVLISVDATRCSCSRCHADRGVLGLADLALLRSGAFKVLSESAFPIDQGLVCRRA
jgi:hypothetical protein